MKIKHKLLMTLLLGLGFVLCVGINFAATTNSSADVNQAIMGIADANTPATIASFLNNEQTIQALHQAVMGTIDLSPATIAANQNQKLNGITGTTRSQAVVVNGTALTQNNTPLISMAFVDTSGVNTEATVVANQFLRMGYSMADTVPVLHKRGMNIAATATGTLTTLRV